MGRASRSGKYLSALSALRVDATRGQPAIGPQESLSLVGDNLPNVIRYLEETHPACLRQILEALTRRVPRLESVASSVAEDGRLLLTFKDKAFKQPIPSSFASDGTLKLLAWLTLLYSPEPPPLVGLEEPENHLHPRLLPELAEECRAAAERMQILVTTHSPHFVHGLRPQETRVLYRDEAGFARMVRAADIPGVPEFLDNGASLDHLWMEGHLGVGDPLRAAGTPTHPVLRSRYAIGED